MSEQNTNDLLIETKYFIEYFSQVFEADFRHRNNFRDMMIPDEIYSVPVDINVFGTAYNWLTQERNELFDSLQSDYDDLIRYTNIDIPNITKQLNKLKKHALLSTALLLNVSEKRSKIKNNKYVKSVKNLLPKELMQCQNYMTI